jgi:hypothetical protein
MTLLRPVVRTQPGSAKIRDVGLGTRRSERAPCPGVQQLVIIGAPEEWTDGGSMFWSACAWSRVARLQVTFFCGHEYSSLVLMFVHCDMMLSGKQSFAPFRPWLFFRERSPIIPNCCGPTRLATEHTVNESTWIRCAKSGNSICNHSTTERRLFSDVLTECPSQGRNLNHNQL